MLAVFVTGSTSASRTPFAKCRRGILRNLTVSAPTPVLVTGDFVFDAHNVGGGQASNLYGSFCPPQTGSYTFKTMHGDWNGGEVAGSKYGDSYASTWASCHAVGYSAESPALQLQKNRCYPYWSWSLADTCWGQSHTAQHKIDGGNYVNTNGALTYDCIYDDCDIGFVGSSCTSVDLDCNGNGVPSDGVAGDINSCVCTNGLEPFCDDLTTAPAGHSDPVMTFKYGEKVDSTESVNLGQEKLYYSSSYANFSIRGTIKIPQNGDYMFRVSAHNDVKLTITGANINIGNIDYTKSFDCMKNIVSLHTSSKTKLARGEYQFEISGISGCAIEDQYLSLEWIFYRYYLGKHTTEKWSSVPRRYLTAPK